MCPQYHFCIIFAESPNKDHHRSVWEQAEKSKWSCQLVIIFRSIIFWWEDQYIEFFHRLVDWAKKVHDVKLDEAFNEKNIKTFLNRWNKIPLSIFKAIIKNCVHFPLTAKQMNPWDVPDWQYIEIFVKTQLPGMQYGKVHHTYTT